MHETDIFCNMFEDHAVIISPRFRFIEGLDDDFHLYSSEAGGMTCKWGKTFKDNPTHCPYGPEIADIEITTSCAGIRDVTGLRAPCVHCYKSCSPSGTYMKFEDFKEVFACLTKQLTLTQIALGVDAQAKGNPDLEKILQYCRDNKVMPNITVADIDQETAKLLAIYCGAIAVSWYPLRNENCCFESLKLLAEARAKYNPMLQLNIHSLLALETLPYFDSLIEHLEGDLRGIVRATVLLSLKKKGRGIGWHVVEFDAYRRLVDKFMDRGLAVGFDSCGANKFLRYIEESGKDKSLEQFVEACESCMFSCYINVHGDFFPCSFMEGEGGWKEGIHVADYDDFREIWEGDRVSEWRRRALWCIGCKGHNECPYWEV